MQNTDEDNVPYVYDFPPSEVPGLRGANKKKKGRSSKIEIRRSLRLWVNAGGIYPLEFIQIDRRLLMKNYGYLFAECVDGRNFLSTS